MSKLEKFVLNRAGVRELLQSSEMRSVLHSYAEPILGRCGEGYEMRDTTTDRAGVNIYPDTEEAKADNWENNTLER